MISKSLQEQENAFTLIEVIIAIFILASAGLAVMGLFANSTLLVGRTGERNEALDKASNIIEEIRVMAHDLGETNNFRTDLQSDIEDIYHDGNGPGFNAEEGGGWGSGNYRQLSFDDDYKIRVSETGDDNLLRLGVKIDDVSVDTLITKR